MKHLPNEFIHLRNDKTPLSWDPHDFKTADSWIEGAGVTIPYPFVMLDFDNSYHFERMCTILYHHGINTPIMQTDRGGHIWFQSKTQFSNLAKVYLPLLIQCDIKAWGTDSSNKPKKGYAMVKRYGKWREWLNETETVAELPYWLEPKKRPYSTFTLTDFDEGSRNNNFFRYGGQLKKFRLNKNQRATIIEIINEYLITDPLSPDEIKTITRDIDKNKLLDYALSDTDFWSVDGRTFLHAKMAEYLTKFFRVKKYNADFWIWDSIQNAYKDGTARIKQEIVNREHTLTDHWRKEVIKYMSDKLDNQYQPDQAFKYLGFKNCIMDIDTFETFPPNPDYFTPYYLNVDYTKDFNVEIADEVDKLILDIIGEDQYLTLMQIIGYCMMPHTKAQKAFIFYGTGANGKSVILEQLIRPLFAPYTSAVSMKGLAEKFSLSMLQNSLVNIDSDNSDKYLTDTSIFKKIVTGDNVIIEQKFKPQFDGALSTKIINAFNRLPRVADISKGFSRRLLFLSFTQVFEGDKVNPNLDTWIKDNWDDISKYLIWQGLEAVKILKANRWRFELINPELLKEVEITSDSVKAWIHDTDYTIDYFIETFKDEKTATEASRPTSYYRQEFKEWCIDNGYQADFSANIFSRRIIDIFPTLTTEPYYNKFVGKNERRFVIRSKKENE